MLNSFLLGDDSQLQVLKSQNLELLFSFSKKVTLSLTEQLDA
jgi:hypothetical protein